MPTACRNFPRVTLRDPRGIFITLSHFCPTAARVLLDAGDIAIVDAPPSLALTGDVEGLDAVAVMPPLLRRAMLMDLDGYTAWEQAAIAVLNDRRYTAGDAIDVIAAATRDTVTWNPGRESLSARITRAFVSARWAHPPTTTPHRRYAHAVKAFLAAHLFASWAAYQNGGITAVVAAVRTAHDLVDREFTSDESFIECVREADSRLRHHINTPLNP
jgi:hypothetical protein